MREFRGLTILGVIAVAGCNLTTDLPTSQRVGLMNVTQLGGGDSATIDANAVFFQTGMNVTYGIPNTGAVSDTCSIEDYNGPVELPPVPYDNLNAGPSIDVTTDKGGATMLPAMNEAGTVIYSMIGEPVPFTPGSNLNIQIPGDTGGFPAQSLTVKTLIAPTLAPIERHPAEDLQLSWSSGGTTNSAIQLQFLFSSDSGGSPNKSMICALRDDGSQTLSKFNIGDWAKSPDAAQSVSGFRWNTTLQQNQDVLMDVITQVMINPVTFAADEGDVANIRASASR